MHRSLCSFLALAALLLVLPASAQSVNKAKLDSLFDRLAAANRAMGSVAVSRGGQLVYTRAYGYADVAKKREANTDTRYRVGSVTKTFVSAMVLQLAEEGKLKLDDKLAKFYPKVPNADKITLEQMLSHHSGIYSLTDADDYEQRLGRPHTQAELLGLIEKSTPQFEPGAKGDYSNSNYILLGFIIEKVTGKPLAENLQTRIAKPLDLKNTSIGGKINTGKNEAQSYKPGAKGWEPATETDMSIPGGAGAVVSTPTDLVRFYSALFQGKLLKPASVDKMKDIKDGFGLGLFRFPFGKEMSYGHTGGIDGFSSMTGSFIEEDLNVAITFNGLNTSMNDVMIGVLSIVKEKPYRLPEYKAAVYFSPEQLKNYEGIYATSLMPTKFNLFVKDNRLMGQLEGQSSFPLEARSATEFTFEKAGVVLHFPDAAKGDYHEMVLKQRGMEIPFVKEGKR